MSMFHLRQTDPQLLGRLVAHNRVHRGIRWLQPRNPHWHLRFFHLLPSGSWICRVHDAYENESAISLAFETDSNLADKYGYVSKYIALRKLKLWGTPSLERHARKLGFSADMDFHDRRLSARGEQVKRWKVVTSDMLNEAWSNGAWMHHYNRMFTIRHPTDFDRKIDADMNEVMASLARFARHSLWQRLFGRMKPKTT